MPLPRVLLTRSPQRAAELLSRLEKAGLQGIAIPHTVQQPLARQAQLPDLEQFNWLAFTSVTAVECFTELLQREQQKLPATLSPAAVGKVTANAVQMLLGVTPLIPEQSGGAELAAALLKENVRQENRKVLWPAARIVAGGFAEVLTEQGFEVRHWPVYRTSSRPAAELQQELAEAAPWQLAVFTAPSAVTAYRAAMTVPWQSDCLAIGNTTAEALLKAGCPVEKLTTAVAGDLLSAILELLAGKPQN